MAKSKECALPSVVPQRGLRGVPLPTPTLWALTSTEEAVGMVVSGLKQRGREDDGEAKYPATLK